MGFVPHVVDINGDGLGDIISGSYAGGDHKKPDGSKGIFGADVYVFYRRADGTFEERKKLADCHTHAIVSPIDWDGDGDFDLVTADRSSNGICLMVNIGSRTDPKFAAPEPLLSALPDKASRELMIKSAAPIDWDGDGLIDLLAGTEWGNIIYFKNEGTKAAHKFGSSPHVLAGKSTVGMSFEDRGQLLKKHRWGSRLAISVVDWDGDGVNDVIAGDSKSETLTEEQLLEGASEAERAAYHEAQTKLKELEAKSRKLRDGKDFAKMSKEEQGRYREATQKLYEEYAPYRKLMNEKYPSRKSHGYVWVFKGMTM